MLVRLNGNMITTITLRKRKQCRID